ncbi:stage II sporulation protein R [bacterium D16-51]|nr:stage II sporulation protein R [bacterium D16-59]RKI60599.1 stage II sporulation protein R [bacterium D16-51]
MYKKTISEKKNTASQRRWVLLERIPTILTPRVLLLFFLYSVAFTLFLIGLKLFFLEQKAAGQASSPAVQSSNRNSTQEILYSNEDNMQLQKNIAKNIIRLHVIANSDSDTDQALKLAVRDEIIGSLQEALKNTDSIEQAENIILSHKEEIYSSAKKVLDANNHPAKVTVTLKSRYFPVKQYGDLTFPAGIYQALCIEIGKAEGRNWWCVLFPSLCFVDETTAAVPEESKDKLKENLSEEEYNALSSPEPSDESSKPELHFGILDWLKGL